MSNLILVTESYPLGALTEAAFIEPELNDLLEQFDRVILVPIMDRGTCHPLPEGIEVSRCVIDSGIMTRKWKRFFKANIRPGFLEAPAYAIACSSIASAIRDMVNREKLDPDKTLGYSFWFDLGAVALMNLKRLTGIRFVSRAHGYDVRMNKAPKLRLDAIKASEGVWAVSRHGENELKEKFPSVADKISTACLGVNIPEETAVPPSSAFKKLSFISCSRVAPEKRVDYNIRFLRALAVARPDYEIRLTHLGGSTEEIERLGELAGKPDPIFGVQPNFKAQFSGNLPHPQVIDIMINGQYDWYILLSTVEGLPVAMMEAMSLGIPPVITDAGGSTEAVDDECGIVLPLHPEPEQFVRGIAPYIDTPARHDACSVASRRKIKTHFNSAILRKEWAIMLRQLID